MPLVIYGLRGIHTHTHTHTLADKSDYKKPGALACGRRAWFKKVNTVQLDLNLMLASIVLAFKIARIACAQP